MIIRRLILALAMILAVIGLVTAPITTPKTEAYPAPPPVSVTEPAPEIDSATPLLTPEAELLTVGDWSWVTRNSSNSVDKIRIYANSDCTGSYHDLWPGDTAKSSGWDGVRAWKRYMVTVFDDVHPHEELAERRINAGNCSKMENNYYHVTVFSGSLIW